MRPRQRGAEASHKHTPTEGAHTCHSRVQLHARLCGPNPSHGAPPALPQRPSPRPGACCTLQALPPQVPAARRQPRRAAADALEDGRLHGECAADDDEGRPDVHPRHLAGPVQTRSLRRTPHRARAQTAQPSAGRTRASICVIMHARSEGHSWPAARAAAPRRADAMSGVFEVGGCARRLERRGGGRRAGGCLAGHSPLGAPQCSASGRAREAPSAPRRARVRR